MTLGWAQIVWLMIQGIRLGTNAARHGEWTERQYHAGVMLLCIAFDAGLLYWGGFFS